MLSAMPRRLFAASLLLLALADSTAARQQTAPPAAERAAEFFAITFAAVTTDGAAAPLRREDVAIRIDGRPREIRSLQLVSIDSAAGAAVALPPPFGTNAVTSRGRNLLLLIDDESFAAGSERALRQAADRLLASVSAGDRISLATIPHGGVMVPATTDRVRIRTALATLAGRADAGASGSALACRTRLSLEAVAHHLRAVPASDAPTIVALVTSGLAAPRRDAPVTMAPGMCELPLAAFRDVGEAAGRARAQFYVVPPGEIMSVGTLQRENIAGFGAQGSDNPVEGIEQLLGVTGGTLLNVGAGERTAFDRIVRESTAYYVATIEPQGTERGRAHGLEVRVARSGVDVRSSRSITFADVDRRAARTAAPSTRDMLSTLAEFRDLPLRAAAYPTFEEESGQIRVLAVAEPIEPSTTFSAMAAALFDRAGKPAGGWVAQPADLERPFVIGAMTAPPGAYRLRVAAIDAAGRSGTADYDVDVALAQTGGMKISAILLGLSRGGTFVPRLQFTTEPVVIGYVELAGAAPGAKVTASLELADGPNAPARISVPLTIEAGAAGRYVARAALPIGAIPPGDYVVRAMVALDDHPMTRVIRTLRKALPVR